MKQIKDSVSIHAYKHNGNLYRVWDKATVYRNNDEELILINESIYVTEENGRRWRTAEPAIWFFSKKNWFNAIAMFKPNGLTYYCNLASPFLIEGQTVKYIDYDLDIKVFHDNSYKIVDLREFNRHRLEWNYPREIVEDLWETIDQLKKMIEQREQMFNREYVQKIWDDYVENYK